MRQVQEDDAHRGLRECDPGKHRHHKVRATSNGHIQTARRPVLKSFMYWDISARLRIFERVQNGCLCGCNITRARGKYCSNVCGALGVDTAHVAPLYGAPLWRPCDHSCSQRTSRINVHPFPTAGLLAHSGDVDRQPYRRKAHQ